ncbi:MAG: glycosyltransferase family 4 protein [Sarcina sp.]
MNILFLSLGKYEKGIYRDLLLTLKNRGHSVTMVSPIERREKKKSTKTVIEGVNVLEVKTFNIQKTNKIEKVLSLVTIDLIFERYIKKNCVNEKFDLILYATPPITFSRVIDYIKKRDAAKSYLLLKDIFPQNAVDLGFFKKKGVIYKFFRRKEKRLYENADYIGCMSDANILFLVKENSYINKNKVEINPNSIIPSEYVVRDSKLKFECRERYNLPKDKIIFAYGGSLGKPQGIDFLIDILICNKDIKDIFFFIAGNGTEYKKLESAIVRNNIKNVMLKPHLPKKEYEELLNGCDVGLIFLDKRFTIPNIPSRLLNYLDIGMPVIAATDLATDIGGIITAGEFGFACKSGDLQSFNNIMKKFKEDKNLIDSMGEKARMYLEKYYTAEHSAEIILKHFGKGDK